MAITDKEELKTLEKDKRLLEAIQSKLDTRLNNLQSAAFNLANYYFVFQGVILTIICNGSETLKKSDRWFLFTLSIIAIVLNSIALIRTGIRYIETQTEYADVASRKQSAYSNISSLREHINSPDPNIQVSHPSDDQDLRERKKKEN